MNTKKLLDKVDKLATRKHINEICRKNEENKAIELLYENGYIVSRSEGRRIYKQKESK